MPVCTQGMQRTWWPEAGTIIVTGPYTDIHYSVMCHLMSCMAWLASQVTGNSTVFSAACSGKHQRRHQSCILLALLERKTTIHRWIPLTKGQLCESRFHVMTTSCNLIAYIFQSQNIYAHSFHLVVVWYRSILPVSFRITSLEKSILQLLT